MAGEYGPAIVDGVVQYFSATSLQTGDRRTQEGCERKYYYEYVERRPRIKTAALEIGSKVDQELTAYQETGVKDLGHLAMTAMHMMPPRGEGVLVQQEIRGILKIGSADVVGKIDLINFRGLNYGGTEFDEVVDPPNTIEILDWKTTSDFKWCKPQSLLYKTIQMALYGEAISQKYNPDYIRLSHGYIRTRGGRVPAKKVTDLVSRVRFLSVWSEIEQVGERLIDVAKAKKPEDVDANLKACNAFGGCPHKIGGYCTAATHNSLSNLFGEEIANMSILSKLELVQPVTQSHPVAPDLEAEIAAMQATLLAKEAAARAAKDAPSEAFKDAVAIINRASYQGKPSGWPPLGGEAARQKSLLDGIVLQGHGLAGSGRLGGIPVLMTCEQVVELARELTAAGHVPSPSSDVAPAPIPSPAPQALAHYEASAARVAVLPPDAPVSNPALAADPLPTGEGAVVLPAPKRGPGRPPKNIIPPPVTQVQATPVPPAVIVEPVVVAETPVVTQAPASVFTLYVNAIPSGPYLSLDTYVRNLCTRLEEQHKVVDIRIAGNDSGLAYGKWKGVVAALVRMNPPVPGVYVIVRPDEIAEVVCDALRNIVTQYVHGVSAR